MISKEVCKCSDVVIMNYLFKGKKSVCLENMSINRINTFITF